MFLNGFLADTSGEYFSIGLRMSKVQLLVCSCVTLIFSAIGFLSPVYRGSILQAGCRVWSWCICERWYSPNVICSTGLSFACNWRLCFCSSPSRAFLQVQSRVEDNFRHWHWNEMHTLPETNVEVEEGYCFLSWQPAVHEATLRLVSTKCGRVRSGSKDFVSRNEDSQRSGQHYWGLEENNTSDCFFAPPACLGSANMIMCRQRNDQFCCFSDWIHANQFEWLSHLRCLLEMSGALMDLPGWFWRYPGTVFCIFFILDLFIWGEALRDTPRAGIKTMTMITMHWWILQSSLGHLRTVKENCTPQRQYQHVWAWYHQDVSIKSLWSCQLISIDFGPLELSRHQVLWSSSIHHNVCAASSVDACLDVEKGERREARRAPDAFDWQGASQKDFSRYFRKS